MCSTTNENVRSSAGTKKVLGLQWNEKDDKLRIPVDSIIDFAQAGSPTKCTVLQTSALLFDPLGLVAPYIIQVKMMFQELWRRQLS